MRIVPGRHGLELKVEGILLFFQASLLHNLVFVVSVFILLCDCASGIVCSLLCLELLFRAGDGMLLSLLDLRCQIVDGVSKPLVWLPYRPALGNDARLTVFEVGALLDLVGLLKS